MDVSFDFNIDVLERSVDLSVKAFDELTIPLKRLGGKIRADARRSIAAEGPGFAPLAPSTLARKPSMAHVELLHAMRGTGPRGDARLRRAGLLKVVDQAGRARLKAQQARTPKQAAKWTEKADQREHVLAAAVRTLGVKVGVTSVHQLVQAAEDDLARRKMRREGFVGAPRYKNSEASTKMLGGLGHSIGIEVRRGVLRVFDRIPWSGVQNLGGTVGHNANIPARTYLKLGPAAIRTFADHILPEHIVGAWNKG